MLTNKTRKEYSVLKLFSRFIRDTQKGRRLLPNGEKISRGTIGNYKYTLLVLKKFCICKGFYLRIRPTNTLNTHELMAERNYWRLFYRQFTDYMYNDCHYFDNYAGSIVKTVRVFFNYLNKELIMSVGDFHKSFYVRKEEIGIFPLTPARLNFLVNDKEFENSLSRRMKQVKDFFVFGCTVALRFSDLKSLKKSNIKMLDGQYYLFVQAQKNNTETLMKLPPYAVEIINKAPKWTTQLLPHFNKSDLNKYIKRLLETAGFTEQVIITRGRRGKAVELRKPISGNQCNRFCDVATTHTMRRTAITTMLSLGVPEQLVRKVSGHAPGSKEFYRYVAWAQIYQDKALDKMFLKLEEQTSLVVI